MLLVRPGHAEHFCICLARLGGTESIDTLVAYLEGCADGSLQRNGWAETVVPEWALGAILELQRERGAEARQTWDRFVARQVPPLQEGYRERAAHVEDLFPRVMALLDDYFEASS